MVYVLGAQQRPPRVIKKVVGEAEKLGGEAANLGGKAAILGGIPQNLLH